MFRFFFSLFLFLPLFAKNVTLKPKNSQLGEITADEFERKGDEIIAKGNVVLISGDYYIVAEDLKYNQKSKIALIDGEARVYQGDDLVLSAKKLKLDFGKDEFSLSSLYLQNNQTGLWVSTTQAKLDNGIYEFKEGTISGCEIQNPVWHLDMSSASFDTKENVMTLWNARAYLGKMPFLYIPYMNFSVQNERKSGLLYPNLGYIDREGFYYDQPIYIAPQEFWDLTLSGQVRTLRGYGLTSEFRFATPRGNLFALQGKYFYNNPEYSEKYLVKNQHIYGINLFYGTSDGTGIFDSSSAIQDGFFLDFSYLNDLDYLRIDDVGKKITDRLNVSKLNYFIHSQNHYLGIYNKYFFDFGTLDNRETLQLIPEVQYHKFLDSLFLENLMYSFDFQTSNVSRARGYGYNQNTITLPLGIEFPLFNNYFSIGVATDLVFTNVNFFRNQKMVIPGGGQPSRNANFFTANYVATLTSDIAKDYNLFLHSIQFEAKASGPYYRNNSRMFDTKIYKAYAEEALTQTAIYNLWNPISIVDFDVDKPTVELQLSQYFYTPEGRSVFYYNVSQKLNLESREFLFSSSMQNEIGSSPIEGLDFKGTLYYSFLHSVIQSASASADFSRWRIKSSFGYYYKNLFISDQVKTDANFLNFSLKGDFGYFATGGSMSYDFINHQVKDWDLILSTDIRCFGISFKFGQKFTPMLTDQPNQPIETVINNYVKIELRIIPLGDVGVSYRFKK